MTKKDYVLIADCIKTARIRTNFDNEQSVNININLLVWQLCKALKQDNPLFDEKKFVDYLNYRKPVKLACGCEGTVCNTHHMQV